MPISSSGSIGHAWRGVRINEPIVSWKVQTITIFDHKRCILCPLYSWEYAQTTTKECTLSADKILATASRKDETTQIHHNLFRRLHIKHWEILISYNQRLISNQVSENMLNEWCNRRINHCRSHEYDVCLWPKMLIEGRRMRIISYQVCLLLSWKQDPANIVVILCQVDSWVTGWWASGSSYTPFRNTTSPGLVLVFLGMRKSCFGDWKYLSCTTTMYFARCILIHLTHVGSICWVYWATEFRHYIVKTKCCKAGRIKVNLVGLSSLEGLVSVEGIYLSDFRATSKN